MLMRILGILDLLAASSLLLATLLPTEIMIVGAFYLLLKGGFFLCCGDFTSLFDIAIAIYIMLVSFGTTNTGITAIAALFLMQKSIFSIIG